ncbi:RNA methyltransferase [Rhodomicrobium sp. Az07]|uniref:RNA methyltransferase n=1 Tax=Rhodomicrobium sp. Az07 TaxID=2839034 RepID=UPI001BE66160|nr:RNA methyltransferase [Rhodomicrobium sp. Az07]MBT3071692.1 RNA methyltransferase [Rhodomicrobium sp. Az07]
MTSAPSPSAPAIILVEPQLGENIGAAARAMANFGLRELRLVAPRDGWPNEAARASAALAVEIVDGARLYPDLAAAVADLHYIVATTARSRFLAKPVLAPDSAVTEIAERQGADLRCGVLFGKERTGLENSDVAIADALMTAPVDPAFASLNLAQSVLLFAYEWRKLVNPHSLGRALPDAPLGAGHRFKASRPAERGELIGFYEHLEGELDHCGFLFPPEKRETMVNNIRTMFGRMAPTEQEVRTLRGIVAILRRGPWQGSNKA